MAETQLNRRRPTMARWAATALVATIAVAPASAGELSAGEIIAAMIEAHGGMERWAAAPTVSFEDNFKPAGAEQGRAARVTVEQGPRRAYIDFPGTEMWLAWDGEKAWSESWGLPSPPRFLALLNYHFLNLPWLATDPGVHLGEPGTARLWDDPTDYVTVKITYGEGVGDTPDDYFVLYVHPETHRLAACEYIVTYTSILPEGVEASTPHILVYEDFATVEPRTATPRMPWSWATWTATVMSTWCSGTGVSFHSRRRTGST